MPTADPLVAIPALLARRGYRLTRPRRAVVEALAAGGQPLTVADILDRVGAGRADRASVYRTVRLLDEVGLLRRTDTAHGQARYELAEPFTAHHHHLLCQGCGRIEDLDGCLLGDEVLARLRQRLRQGRGFRVTGHELRFLGRCRACAP